MSSIDQQLLLKLMLNAPMGICILDAVTQVSEVVNDAFLHVAGRTREQIIGHYYWDTFAEVRHLFEEDLNRASAGETIRGNQLQIPLIRYGITEIITINFIYMPLRDESGKVTKVAVWVEDNTKEATAKQAVADSEERLTALVAATSDVVYSLSPDWEIMQPLDGRGFLQDTGKPITGWRQQNVHPDDMDRVNIAIQESIREKKIFQLEHKVLRADGSPGWTFSRAVPILDANGEISEWFGMASDMTPYYQALESLQHTKQLLEQELAVSKQVERKKNDFISMVSHELKTPLTTFSGLVQLAIQKVPATNAPFFTELMTKANIQVKRMTSMINGFLNVSRFESGKISIDKTVFDLEALIQEVMDETVLTLTSHELVFTGCGTQVLADREKIYSVIVNLVSNAVKYSPGARMVNIHCTVQDNEVIVCVEDKGIGINKSDLENIFDRYYRVSTDGTRHIAGFGIGLYLSTEIIRRHDGRIWVESEPGHGSAFYFSLPLTI